MSYQSAADRTQRWTVGWLPSVSLTPVQPARAREAGDWIGRWIHAGGAITISRGRRGTLRIRGEHVYPAAQNVHSGVIRAEAKPAQGLLQFADDGSASFDAAQAPKPAAVWCACSESPSSWWSKTTGTAADRS